MPDVEDRCRLVLVAPDIPDADLLAQTLGDALRGGDVASVIVPQYDLNDDAFQRSAELLVPIVQQAGAAALIAGESRIAARTGADGLHIAGGVAELQDAMERFAPKWIVGGGRPKDRHAALEVGELRPDYVFFGRLDGDIKDEAHPKNLALAEWWASMVEIPCVVMGGLVPDSAVAVAETGAEFVALRKAVFAEPGQAAMIVARINALLDEKAPRFDD